MISGYYQVPEYSTIKITPALTQLQLTSGSQIVGGQGHQPGKRPGGTSLDNLIPPMFSGQVNKPKPAPQQPAGSGMQKVRPKIMHVSVFIVSK